jgi:hypothetical protein
MCTPFQDERLPAGAERMQETRACLGNRTSRGRATVPKIRPEVRKKHVLLLWIPLLLLALGLGGHLLQKSLGPRELAERSRVFIGVGPLREASGLTTSRRAPGLFWSLNDSGGQPVLYAFDEAGAARGSVRVRGIANFDWEAIAAFELDGKAYLAIGDIGDNRSVRREGLITVIEEPDPASLQPGILSGATAAWKIAFRFPEGARDCETMLVDARRREILLVSKRTHPPVLYQLPLQVGAGAKVTARKLGEVATLPQPNAFQRLIPSARGRFLGQPTDGAISPDDSLAAILTYGEVVLFKRSPGGSWTDVLRAQPWVFLPHDLPMAEGVTFSADSKTLWLTTEGSHPALLGYALTGR